MLSNSSVHFMVVVKVLVNKNFQHTLLYNTL
jgi:hypothetical protein